MINTKAQLRSLLRQQRQALSPTFHKEASACIVQKLIQLDWFHTSQRIALYLHHDNEIDLSALFTLCPDKKYYLPLLTPTKHLKFCRYENGTTLQTNHVGIREPIHEELCPPEELELVCVPLVGFDPQGHRLGMGGGYYDRTFAFKKRQENTYPFLVGIAYECQKVATLPHVDWDIPLNLVLTEQSFYPQTSA